MTEGPPRAWKAEAKFLDEARNFLDAAHKEFERASLRLWFEHNPSKN